MPTNEFGSKSGANPASIGTAISPSARLITLALIYLATLATISLALASFLGWQAGALVIAFAALNDAFGLAAWWLIDRERVNNIRQQLQALLKEARRD